MADVKRAFPTVTIALLLSTSKDGMRKPVILDLFCGAGGCAVGYHRAGFDVVGVDMKPQPRFPFAFQQWDALLFMTRLLDAGQHMESLGFDAIHASPPCQRFSALRNMGANQDEDYPDLVEDTRELLIASGLPYVIENVPKAPLHNPVTICGTAVGLPIVDCLDQPRQVHRHRIFETNWTLLVPPCQHTVPALGTYGQGGRWKRVGPTSGTDRRGGYQGSLAECLEGMGIDWMSRREVGQAIPPAYTELIGAQLLAVVEQRVAA